jgi:tellurite resistance protein TehA-like permease
MYNFIFWFFYKFHEWKDKDNSSFVPSCVVMVVFIIHVGLRFSIIRYFSGITTPLWGEELSYGQRKYLMFPFAVLLFFLVWFLYYRKKAKYILEKYEGQKPFTVKKIISVVLIIVVPLIIAIKFTNMALD